MTLPLKFKSTISLFRLGKYGQNATSISAMNISQTRYGMGYSSFSLFDPSKGFICLWLFSKKSCRLVKSEAVGRKQS
jgi:hypothetical protein